MTTDSRSKTDTSSSQLDDNSDSWIIKTRRVFSRAFGRMKDDMDPGDESDIALKKKRFVIISVFGIIMAVIAFFISISIAAGGVIPISDAISSLVSSIGKHGVNLNEEELYIFESRLPRALAAIAVGAGLSIAGCMFQAIIRNPLVDPYITGVSSGAGCLAVAVGAIGASIPFMGADNLYLVPIAAIVGGLIAFGITMLVAECSGGSATNYILAGVIVGFAFSSIQTIYSL